MLLSEQELRAALEPLLDRLLADRLRLQQLEYEPRLKLQIDAAVRGALGEQAALGAGAWSEGLLRLLAAAGCGECCATLFELARRVVQGPTALLIIRRDEAALFAADAVDAPSRFTLEPRDVVGAAVSRQKTQACDGLRRDANLPVWGRSDAAAAHPITVARQAVAVLYWQRPLTLVPPARHCLEALTAVAGLALWRHALALPAATVAAQP